MRINIAGRCVGGLLLIALAMLSLSAMAQPIDGAVTDTSVQRYVPAEDAQMEAFVDSLLALMTVEEKLGQLTLYVARWSDVGPRVPEGGEAEIRAGTVGTFYGIYGATYTCEMQRIAVDESRLGIPLLFAHDVIHGFRTTFPMPLAEASSWNPEAVHEAARIVATEAAAHGLHWTFGPMIDISRDPRWGRVTEGFGEDPYLGSQLAAARVRGFQGDDLGDMNTVMATAKHYAAYGAAEAGRDYNTVDISERTLREVYLPPFKAAVEAGVGSVMAAFNEVAGVPMHAHGELINGLLRQEWGWDGILLSDYTGVLELIPHGVAADSAEAGVMALRAGVDVDIVSGIYLTLEDEIASGRLEEGVVNEAVWRMLRAKYKLGLFDDPYRYCDAEREATAALTDEFVASARAAAQQSMVLLKNESDVLPFSNGLDTLAVIGDLADDRRVVLGTWVAAGRAENAVDVLEGIRRALPDTEVLFVEGTPSKIGTTDTTGFAEAVRVAQAADAVVLVLGEHHDMSAEAASRATIDLPGLQRDLAEVVLSVGKPTAVVLMNGRPLAIPYLAEHAPAILEAWYLGVQMGPAVADVLFGDVSPSGKLPVTFPRAIGQAPLYYNHKPTGRPPDAEEKYTSKYLDVPWTPQYPFGHGLSYTTFGYDDLRLSSAQIAPGDTLMVQVNVTNTGEREGAEVVQLYVRDEVASVTRPVKELKGFERITLQPGAIQTVTFTLTADDLQFWGPDEEWITEPGYFTVFVGGSSAETLSTRFELTDE